MIKVGSSTSGIMAEREALKKLKIKHNYEFVIDIDKDCRDVIKLNSNPKMIYEDMTKIDPKTLKYVDFYMCSPPCQTFSNLGKKEGLAGKNKVSKIIDHVVKYIQYHKPKCFILEEVKTFATINNGEDMNKLIKKFKKNNVYEVNHCILNAKEFQTPQTRSRLYIVGIRVDTLKKNKHFCEPRPTGHVSISKIFEKNVENPKRLEAKIDIEGVKAMKNKHGSKYLYDPLNMCVSILGQTYKPEKNQCFLTVNFGISPAIMRKHANKVYVYHLRRFLTVREVLRCFGFSESFKHHPNPLVAFKQCGNSICVNCLVELMKSIKYCSTALD